MGWVGKAALLRRRLLLLQLFDLTADVKYRDAAAGIYAKYASYPTTSDGAWLQQVRGLAGVGAVLGPDEAAAPGGDDGQNRQLDAAERIRALRCDLRTERRLLAKLMLAYKVAGQ